MSTNFENSEEKIVNLSMEDMIFVDEILNERKIIINSPLVDVVENDLDRAATLTRYVFFFKLNNFQPFALTDQKVADSLRISVKKIERAKAWLKEHDFISVKRVGIPAVGYITVNISKVKELYRLMESSSPYSGNWNPVFGEHIYNIPERDNIRENILSKTSFDDANVSSIKPKKIKVVDDWKNNEAFVRLWDITPKYSKRCGAKEAYKAWKQETKNGTVNVEKIEIALPFYLRDVPPELNPQHLSTFLHKGTWEEFYARAVEQEQKKEKARALREKQQKEEAEQKKRVLKERAQVFEAKYQALKNKLNAGYDTLEEISQENEELFYDVVQQIRDYERKLEEKEAEIKHQKEIEQKKIDAENSKHNLDECERELWTYISQAIDVNTYLDRNKKRFPNSYITFKALFSNGETLLDVVFGKLAKDTVVDRLKNNILSFLINEMANEEARNLYNKRNDAWTKWNQLTKAIA